MLTFALFGHPVQHSLSPVMHRASFDALGLQATYQTVDVAPDALASAVAQLRQGTFQGVNVTVPHKIAVLPYLDRLDESAELYGAVNTIEIQGQTLIGHNTDAAGFLTDLAHYGIDIAQCRVLVLGCGGAGRSLAIAATRAGARAVDLANRTMARAQALADELQVLNPRTPVTVVSLTELKQAQCPVSADLILQCTTSGLTAEDQTTWLPARGFRPGQFLYDLVYTQRATPIMQAALQGGAQVANGMGMLVEQGALAFNIWTGQRADIGAMRRALERQIYQV